MLDIKEAYKLGVDGVLVMLPNMLVEKENFKALKKQLKALSKFKKRNIGIGVSIGEISEDRIKWLIKTVERFKINHLTFVFGEQTFEEVKSKMCVINKAKGKKQIKIMGNVENIESVVELFKMDCDYILTPFADSLGEELIKRFKIKSLKLR